MDSQPTRTVSFGVFTVNNVPQNLNQCELCLSAIFQEYRFSLVPRKILYIIVRQASVSTNLVVSFSFFTLIIIDLTYTRVLFRSIDEFLHFCTFTTEERSLDEQFSILTLSKYLVITLAQNQPTHSGSNCRNLNLPHTAQLKPIIPVTQKQDYRGGRERERGTHTRSKVSTIQKKIREISTVS